MVAREALSTIRAALLPVAVLRPMPEPAPVPGRRPVVMVHGFLGHPGMFRPLARRLLKAGFPAVEALRYPSTQLHLEEIVERIAAFADEVAPEGKVHLVGHSLGAVACRAWLKCFGGASRVARFVALGGPHAGTSLYRIVPAPVKPAMDPRGPWVRRLSQGPEPVPTTVIRSRYDTQVYPPTRGEMPGATEIVLHGFGHNGLLWSKEAHEAVIRALTEPIEETPAQG